MGKGRWNLTVAIAVYANTPSSSCMMYMIPDFWGGLASIVPKETEQCPVKFFFFSFFFNYYYFIFPLNWDLESRNVEMLSWKDIFKKRVFKVTLPKNSKLISNLLIRQAQTRFAHLHYDQNCCYELFIWQNSNWNRVSLSAVTLKRMRTYILWEKYLQTNHCQIFVQLRFTFCLIKKMDVSWLHYK